MSFLSPGFQNRVPPSVPNAFRLAKPYLIPVLSVFVALQINWLVAQYLSFLPPFLTFLAAVMVTAWFAGFRSALGAIVLSTLAIDYFFIEPIGRFVPQAADLGTIAFFAVEAVAIAYCIDYLRRNAEGLRQVNVELENRVSHKGEQLREQEERLHRVMCQLSSIEERERQALAAELHDYLAQLLVLARMKLKQARPQGGHSSAGQSNQWIGDIDDLLHKSLAYVRTLMADLYPVELSKQGLPAALRWLAEQMSKHGLTVEVSIQGEQVPIRYEQAVLLYQSVRELLMNIVKHAAVSRAVVSLAVVSEDLLITVRDSGRGFDSSERRSTAAGERFGLSSVRERMSTIGGQFSLESAVGQGTTVTLRMPLKQILEFPSLRAASAPQPDRVKSKPAAPSEQESLPL